MPDELACCRYMDQWDKVLVRALIKASGNTGRNIPLKQYMHTPDEDVVRNNPVGGKIITKRRGEKLAPVIALHTPDEDIELCRDKLEEAKKGVTCVRLGT